MEVNTDILLGDSKQVLKQLPDNSVDLIFTSPPYADQRKNTYGGVHPDKYVEWFLPISKELLRVLKPTGTFILNIKEKVVNGERSTYVMELILEMRKQGWLWTEEFISGHSNLYKDIIEPIGHKAKEKNEFFIESYSNMINKFTKEFSNDFCNNNGQINWEKLVEFNSAR